MKAIKNVIARLRYAAGQVDLKLADDAETELAELYKAAEKMAEQLRCLRDFQQEAEARGQSSIIVEVDHIFNSVDDAALTAWEAANK